MLTREEILTALQAHQDDFVRFGVKSLRLFGSTARDEMRPDSDVDLLVAFESSPSDMPR